MFDPMGRQRYKGMFSHHCDCLESGITLRGCPMHAPELYVEYLVRRFETGPTSVVLMEDPTSPARAVVVVDGRAGHFPLHEALHIYNDALDAMNATKKNAA
jgi:hypothetical protein